MAVLRNWNRVEYAAGYGARMSEIPDSDAGHQCWRDGWEDADTEMLEWARHKHVLANGGEDNYPEPGVSSSVWRKCPCERNPFQ